MAATEMKVEPEVESLSMTDKLIGILTEPSATYENLHLAGPKTSNWMIPLLLAMAIFAIGMVLRFQNPDMLHQITMQQQEQIMKKVESGELSQEKADEIIEQMGQYSGMVKIFGPISATVGFAFFVFLLVLLYWLLVRYAFKGNISFRMTLNVYGLILFISAIDQLIGILLSLLTDRAFITLSPALFMDQDLGSTMYKAMMQINPFTIWSLFVLSIGFEKVAGLAKSKALIAAFSISVAMIVVSLALGWAG